MKRFDLLPTDENIKKCLLENSLGLNQKLFTCLDFLDNIDCQSSISIDGKWGEGKTFFVKELKLLLDSLNHFSLNQDSEIKNLVNGKEFKVNYKTVYFDAWENDFHQDPLLSLLFSISKQFSIEYKWENVRFDEIVKNVLGATLKSIPILGNTFDLDKILDGKYVEDLLGIVKEENDLHVKISDFFSSLATENGDRVLIIIDELDRCRPDFAIQLLERIKHYFNCDNVNFLFAINTKELEHIIQRYYGPNYNSSGYLDKFFDFRLSLPKVSVDKYFENLCITGPAGDRKIYISKAVIKLLGLEKREINRFLLFQEIALKKTNQWTTGTDEGMCWSFVGNVVAPCLIGLKIKSLDMYENFIEGKDYSILKNIVNLPRMEFYRKAFCKGLESEEISEEIINLRVEDFCRTLLYYDFSEGSQFRKTVGGYSIDYSIQTLLFDLLSMVSEFSVF